MNYKRKFLLFLLVFLSAFFLIRLTGNDLYTLAHQDIEGIGWLFSIIGLIFSILSGFLIQHLWDKWERVQKVVLEEIHILEHILMFTAPNKELSTQTSELVHQYIEHVISHEWSPLTRLLEGNEAADKLKILHDQFLVSEQSPYPVGNKGVFTKLMNSLFYTRQKRILLTTRRMPQIIKRTFLLSAILVIVLSLLVAIHNLLLDLIFTLSIGSLVFAIYLIVDDMDNILSPGAWHVSSKLYKEFLKKSE